MKNVFLVLGIFLSGCSKLLQFKYGSSLGDVVILPAAMFFVLAVLLYNKRYCSWLAQGEKRKGAKGFALFCCLTVLSFQLFTLFTFGQNDPLGIGFLVPMLVFGTIATQYFRKLYF